MSLKYGEIIKQMSLEEKALMMSGKNTWETVDFEKYGIPSMAMSDGPHGLRRQAGAGDHLGLNASLPATCFPTAATIANSWDEKLGEEIGTALAEEAVTMDVNVIGAYNCAVRVWPHMKQQEYGRIINISSTNGMNTYYPMSVDYDASKAALNSLTHDLAVQFAPFVHVNAIAPGFIGTESELDGYDEEFLKEEEEKILVKRYGRPEEVAHLVRFLISDDADYINNTIVRIDGGQMGSI